MYMYMYITLCFCPHCVQDLLAFQTRELRKSFKDGDHVKVVSGRYEGETGLIVRIEHNLAILFSDLTMHEVCWVEKVQRVFYLLHILLCCTTCGH